MSDRQHIDTPIAALSDRRSRAEVDVLTRRLRPWALRQANRSYGHLPERDRVQAVDDALRDLAVRPGADRRALHAALAEELTAGLRRAHVTWCLVQGAPGPADADSAVPAEGTAVTEVVERGLGGLERAVLALEIGAGRDTRTARAALRLGPREYGRHRAEGLTKLRAAVNGQVAGRVCADHAVDVVLAATGDAAAADRLAGGTERCRACAREAQGLRRLLHQRLAVAPWPLAIKPAGLLAAKLGALGALAGGGAGAGPIGAPAAGTVLAAAALAGGTAVVVADHGDRTATGSAAPAAAVAAPVAVMRPAAPAPRTRPASHHRTRPTATTHHRRPAGAVQPVVRKQAPAKPRTAPAPSSGAAPVGTPAPATTIHRTVTPAQVAPETTVQDTVRDSVQTVRDTTAPVINALPAPVAAPVDQALDGAQQTLDGVTGAADAVTGAADGLRPASRPTRPSAA